MALPLTALHAECMVIMIEIRQRDNLWNGQIKVFGLIIFADGSAVIVMTNKETDNMKLLPCPWCGGEAEYMNYEGATGNQWAIECQDVSCIGFSKWHNTFARKCEAAKAWNTRQAPQQLADNMKLRRAMVKASSKRSYIGDGYISPVKHACFAQGWMDALEWQAAQQHSYAREPSIRNEGKSNGDSGAATPSLVPKPTSADRELPEDLLQWVWAHYNGDGPSAQKPYWKAMKCILEKQRINLIPANKKRAIEVMAEAIYDRRKHTILFPKGETWDTTNGATQRVYREEAKSAYDALLAMEGE